MSTEAEQPTVAPVTDTPIVVEENGAPLEVSEPFVEPTTQNGESKEGKKNGAVKKEPEPPKDPKTETVAWLNQQHKKAIHKASYTILKSIVDEAYVEDDASKPVLPKSGFVTRREFINYIKDGVSLARLAKKFKPDAVETVKEGEEAKVEENQKANVEGFITFAKEHVPEDQIFSYEDLTKGKEEFPKVFATLFQLLLAAPKAFNHPGIDFENFFKELSEIVPKKFWQKFVDNLNNVGSVIQTFVRRPFTRSASNGQVSESVEPEQNGAATNGVHTNGTTTEVVHEENGVANGTKIEEKKEEPPAVAAN